MAASTQMPDKQLHGLTQQSFDKANVSKKKDTKKKIGNIESLKGKLSMLFADKKGEKQSETLHQSKSNTTKNTSNATYVGKISNIDTCNDNISSSKNLTPLSTIDSDKPYEQTAVDSTKSKQGTADFDKPRKPDVIDSNKGKRGTENFDKPRESDMIDPNKGKGRTENFDKQREPDVLNSNQSKRETANSNKQCKQITIDSKKGKHETENSDKSYKRNAIDLQKGKFGTEKSDKPRKINVIEPNKGKQGNEKSDQPCKQDVNRGKTQVTEKSDEQHKRDATGSNKGSAQRSKESEKNYKHAITSNNSGIKGDTITSNKSEAKRTEGSEKPCKRDANCSDKGKTQGTEDFQKQCKQNSNTPADKSEAKETENSDEKYKRGLSDTKISETNVDSDKLCKRDKVDLEKLYAKEFLTNKEETFAGKNKCGRTQKVEKRQIDNSMPKHQADHIAECKDLSRGGPVLPLDNTVNEKTKQISIQEMKHSTGNEFQSKNINISLKGIAVENSSTNIHSVDTKRRDNTLHDTTHYEKQAVSKNSKNKDTENVKQEVKKLTSRREPNELGENAQASFLTDKIEKVLQKTNDVANKTISENGDKNNDIELVGDQVDKTERSDKDGDKSCSDSVFESESMSEQSVITIKQETTGAASIPNGGNEKEGSTNRTKQFDRRLESIDDMESGYYSKLQIEELDRSQSVRESVNSWLDKYVPMTREPSKAYEYKVIEEDFSLPNRTYIDHLTTYIPPRLPIEKPDLFTLSPETATLSWKPAKVPDRIRNTCNLTYSIEVRNPPGLDWRELVSGLTSTSYDLKNLHPRLDYLFRIRAHNEYGCSEPCLPVSLHRPIELSDDEFDIEDWDDPYRISLGQLDTPIDEAPPKLPMEAPRITDNGATAHLSWLPARIPAYAKKTPITYIVEIKEPNIPGWSRVTSGITDTNYFVEDLLPNKDYQFRIKAETQFGVSDSTLPVALERTKMEHSMPLLDLDFYEIFRKDWMWPDQKRPSVDYRKEESDFDVPTKPSFSGVPPRMPSSRPLICHRHGNSISLSWNPGRVPSYVKNSKMTYVVEIREPPSPLWRVLADNLTDNEFDITNLTPDQDYMFRVRAKNEFGQSEPTLPASVIREKDDYTPPTLSRSRSGSASPWIGGSRASSVDRQRSFSLTDDDLDIYINRDKKPCPPEFKTPVETTQYGVEGRPAKLLLPLRGYPLPRVSWFYMGERLDYGDLYQASVSQAGVATLDIQRMGQERVGDYKCCVENEHGVAVKIVRLLLADQPTVIEPMKNLSLGVRGSGKLECRVDGTPYPTVKFLKDMRSVVGSSRIKIDHTPPNLWTLSIDGAMSMDAGTYTCIAENMAGKVSSVAKVTLADSETVTMETPIKEKLCEEDYYILEEIGRGRHGVVRRVVDKITGEEYAAKFIPVADDKQRQFFMHEMRNLRSISHKGVPRVIDLYQTERRLVIIMEIITGGNILSYVIRRKNQIEEDVAYYIEQLLIILKYLHGNKILHLDIKPSSVHFIEEGSDNICLLDFGFSRDFSKDRDVRMKFGSVDFTSPEQIANDRVSAATDLWNIGLLTHTLLGGESPFHERTEADTLKRIQECDWSINEDAFDGISTEARDFIKKLLVKEPSERMSLADCLNHPFIKGDCEDGQGQKLNTEKLRAYSKTLRERKSKHLLQTTANLVSLQMILDNQNDVQPVLKGQKNEVGDVTYPESSAFGEFVDEESWFDWQSRAFGGDDDLDEQTDSDPVTRNPSLLKEAEWKSVAEDYKQQSQKPQDFFPKEEVNADNPQFLTKLGNLLFRPGEDITLTCRVANIDSLAVSWYRNDELLSESNRIKITMSDSGEASLVVCAAKPYDDGLYKCVVRSKTGKSSTWARVLVGELPSQPCRPIITQISSCDTLLLWESPTTDADFDIKYYRIDYKEKGTEEWLIGGYTVDQMALISWLKADTTYQFRVCATNNFGSGPYSVSSLPTKTLKDDAEDIELEPLETIVLSKQKPQQQDTRIYDSVPKELTLKEENVDNIYHLSETFYRGQFSEFVLTKEISTNKYFVSREKIQSDSNKDEIQRELEMLRLCQLNQRILRLLDCYLYNSKVYFMHEYFVGVNIVEHFSFKTTYSEDMVAIAIQQVLDGVQFLHQNNIVHLNLQPASIVMLRRASLDLRITDFTLAQNVDSKEGIEVPINGNPEFLAPEVVVQERVSYPADIWTVGALTFLLLSGESPYYERNKEMTLSNIAYNRYNPLALYENITRDALRFIFKVLKRTPRNRMTVDECLEDRWLQGKDSIVKARQEATFTTVKLRSYLERTMANTDEDSLPDLKELRKVFELPDEKRHRFRVPERSFDAEELEKKETKITLKNDEQSTDQQVKTEKSKEVIVTDDEVKDTPETDDKKDEKTVDTSKTSAESIEQAADDLVAMAVKEALHSGEIPTKVSVDA